MRMILAALVVALTPLAGMAETRLPSGQAELSLSYAPVVETAGPAVVNIYATRVVEQAVTPFANDPFFSQLFGDFGQTVPRMQNSLGSGVIVRADGLVVSNYHVVGNATEIRVVLPDRREFDAQVVLADERADLAVLRLAGAHDLPALEFADSEAVAVGDLVLAVGNPFGVGQTVSSGIVSGLARSGGAIAGGGGYFLQTDAPINPGNSGGALVDMQGRLLGINTSILTRSGGSIGIGFAIPANLVARVVEQAEAGNARFQRPWAGVTVQTVDHDMAQALGLDRPQGVMIAELHAQSPFKAAGIEPGDVVLSANGADVHIGAALEYHLLTREFGDALSIRFLRDGREQTTVVTVMAAPDDPPADIRTISARGILQGLTVANANPAVAQEFGLPASVQGVVVLGAEGPAARVGFRPGDVILSVNRVAITDTKMLEKVAGEGSRSWQLEIDRGGQRHSMRIRG